jgi:hypothetical protein
MPSPDQLICHCNHTFIHPPEPSQLFPRFRLSLGLSNHRQKPLQNDDNSWHCDVGVSSGSRTVGCWSLDGNLWGYNRSHICVAVFVQKHFLSEFLQADAKHAPQSALTHLHSHHTHLLVGAWLEGRSLATRINPEA